MEAIGRSVVSSSRTLKCSLASVVLHLLLIGLLIHKGASWIAPIRLPGSEHGSNLILTYLPGRAPLQASAPNPKTPPKHASSTTPLPTSLAKTVTTAAASPNTSSPTSAQPDSAAGADALGSGNINIALASFFPTPQPDLSALPRGTKGDVILDIVIDTAGKIADIKMTRGLGHGVDESVIATVQQWTFHPATKDGQPVASEQELHFHYEKA
ncbi:energy transducer TonB [Granulicella sp. L60]|jgi:periplasmic protein TonB|uniref:energy transducer TonB n=1 Tax=Granulicella sp. L60 TaxID=1641866 RepID=UPI00131CFF00|nr:energy transducer TonB [Granulicella sp. L60]